MTLFLTSVLGKPPRGMTGQVLAKAKEGLEKLIGNLEVTAPA